MADIFISYAHDDRREVGNLVRALRLHGWSVWWDNDLLPGEHYDHVIERELDAARCILVVWSATSPASRNVRNEALVGRQRDCLVPVTLGGASWPSTFAAWQAVDLSFWSGDASDTRFLALCAGVRRLIGDVRQRPELPSVRCNMFTFLGEDGLLQEGIESAEVYNKEEGLILRAIAVSPLTKYCAPNGHWYWHWEPVDDVKPDIVWEDIDTPPALLNGRFLLAAPKVSRHGYQLVTQWHQAAGWLIDVRTGIPSPANTTNHQWDHGSVYVPGQGLIEDHIPLISGTPIADDPANRTRALWHFFPGDLLYVRDFSRGNYYTIEERRGELFVSDANGGSSADMFQIFAMRPKLDE